MALALALSALVFAPAAANAAAKVPTKTYLALGDSISFGFTQEVFNNHYPNESPSYFEEGFTNYFTTSLKKATEVGKEIRLVDDGCPGETSNGLIGEKASLGGQTSTEGPGAPQGPGDWHPCKYHFVSGLPLHNDLGTLSQLEDAVGAVLPKENTKVITVNMGSNDELAGVEECEKEVQGEFESKFYSEQPNSKSAPGDPEDGTKFYVLNGEPAHDKKVEFEAFNSCLAGKSLYVTFPRIEKNIKDVLEVLDGSGYKEPIVVLGFYNPDAFLLPGSDALQKILNERIENMILTSGLPNIHWANPFPKFNNHAGEPAEKTAIAQNTEMCNPNVQKPTTGLDPGCEGDIHPSITGSGPQGYKLIAKQVNKAYLLPPCTSPAFKKPLYEEKNSKEPIC